MTIDSRLRKTIKHSKTVILSPPFPSTAFILSRSRLTAYRIEVALEFTLYSFCFSFATFYLYDFSAIKKEKNSGYLPSVSLPFLSSLG